MKSYREYLRDKLFLEDSVYDLLFFWNTGRMFRYDGEVETELHTAPSHYDEYLDYLEEA
jgi:hypothetical protein